MTREALLVFYEDRRKQFAAEAATVRAEIRRISHLRLAVALVIIGTIYFSFSQPSLLFVVLGAVIGFVALVQQQTRRVEEQVHLEHLERINQQERDALLGKLDAWDTGSSFIDPAHPYTHDLDIFGAGSLYQHINRAYTRAGRRKVAEHLSAPLTPQAIQQQQEAIRELTPLRDYVQHLQAAGMSMKEQAHDRDELLAWLAQPAMIYGNRSMSVMLKVFPVLTIALLIGQWLWPVPALEGLALGAIALQWMIWSRYVRRINSFHDAIGRKKSILQLYARLLQYIRQQPVMSAVMQQVHREACDAEQEVEKLASAVGALNARANVMTMLVVNSVLLYDLQCVYRLERWKATHADRLPRWLDAIRDAEVISSFSTFAFNHPNFTYASITETLNLEADDLGHPLIDDAERINNNIHLSQSPALLIITGANMAGKSTFLRTIGVNVVLALCGAPVCATRMMCPVIGLRTGMRTADSLQDHRSYFYAELQRLKSIMDELRLGQPLLILLDEILKGTNSNDKQAGSIALVKQLLPYPCLAMIATHDLALGQLEAEHPGVVRNFCFEPTIENDQLTFDYKLKPGVATRMNATFLMKKMGIIPSA